MKIHYGRQFPLIHLEDTTPSGSSVTSLSGFTADYSPWQGMYSKDRYARDRVMKAARLLLPYLKDGDTVLDVGCFTQEASKYYPPWIKYVGIDQVQYHQKTKVVDLNHGFEPFQCSHALCLETLEHLIDPEDCLESIYKSLPDHGVLVVSVPNEATLFHRIRCLFGIVDAGCFQGQGKHVHLPSLTQSRRFVSKLFDIVLERYYISPTACNSSQEWVGKILSLFPDSLHQWRADRFPSLFARGFIFLCRKAVPTQATVS